MGMFIFLFRFKKLKIRIQVSQYWKSWYILISISIYKIIHIDISKQVKYLKIN